MLVVSSLAYSQQSSQLKTPPSVWQVDDLVYCIHINIGSEDLNLAPTYGEVAGLSRKSFAIALNTLRKEHPELELISIIPSPAPNKFGEYLIIFKTK